MADVWPPSCLAMGLLRVFCLVTLNITFFAIHFLRYISRRQPADARHGRLAALRTHGDDQIRTGDPLLAKQVLSQLSYIPKWDLFT